MPLSLPRGRSWETQSSLWEVILDDPPSYFSSPQDHISHLLRIIFLVPQSRPLHSVGMQPVLKCQMVGWSQIEKRVHYFCNTTIETLIWKLNFRSFSCSLSEYVDLKMLMLNSYCCSGHQTLENRPDTSNAPSQTLMSCPRYLCNDSVES